MILLLLFRYRNALWGRLAALVMLNFSLPEEKQSEFNFDALEKALEAVRI